MSSLIVAPATGAFGIAIPSDHLTRNETFGWWLINEASLEEKFGHWIDGFFLYVLQRKIANGDQFQTASACTITVFIPTFILYIALKRRQAELAHAITYLPQAIAQLAKVQMYGRIAQLIQEQHKLRTEAADLWVEDVQASSKQLFISIAGRAHLNTHRINPGK